MIEPWQIRAAREALRWSQGQLAQKAGVKQPYISDLEKGRIENPSAQTLQNIEKTFNAEGVYFPPDGLQLRKTNAYTIEGADSYLKILDDALSVLQAGDIFLKSAANERRSSDQVIEKLEEARTKGIKMRSLVKKGDVYLMGDLSEYRWMDDALFTSGDVKVIYADRVAYLVTWSDTPKAVIIQDSVIAEEARRTFDFIWNLSSKPTHSEAKKRFKGIK